MDYLRKCYVTRVRPFAGSNDTAEVRWYWAPEGAPVLRGAIWRSSFWFVQDLDGQYPPPPAIGEERSVPFRWSPGQLGQRLAVAKCIVGDRSWFATGIPPEANVPNPPPLPACCRLPVRIALGGFQLGGRVEAVPIVQGGLLAGGAAIRTPLAASGGPMLGGVTSSFGSFVLGGLLVGGEAFPEPLDAEGGLLVGGEAFPEPLDAEGGLLVGGVQETEPAPVGMGGLWIGGEAQEPMALLYCSLRIIAAQSVPNNTFQTLSWDHVETDPSGMYSPGAPTLVTLPVDGVYLVSHVLTYAGMGAGVNVFGALLKNGAGYQPLYGDDSGPVAVNENVGAALVEGVAGDNLSIQAFQTSGISQALELSGYIQSSFRVAGLAPNPPSGRLLGIQRFTTPGAYTYTPTTGTASVIVELQGGGGGGGGCVSPGAGKSAAGAGGSGGGWVRKRLTANFSGATGTVGSGGAGGAAGANNGSDGTATTFITSGGGPTTYTAPAGFGGGAGSAQSPPTVTNPPASATPAGGDDGRSGGAGLPGLVNSGPTLGLGGAGGSSVYSGGAGFLGIISANGTSAGRSAAGFGGGGGGAGANGTGAAAAGGAGAGGCVVIWEYS